MGGTKRIDPREHLVCAAHFEIGAPGIAPVPFDRYATWDLFRCPEAKRDDFIAQHGFEFRRRSKENLEMIGWVFWC